MSSPDSDVPNPADVERKVVVLEDRAHVPTPSPRARRSSARLIVGMGLLVLLAVLALVVLQGIAQVLALLLVVFVLYGVVAPAVFPQTPWRGPYKDHDFGSPPT